MKKISSIFLCFFILLSTVNPVFAESETKTDTQEQTQTTQEAENTNEAGETTSDTTGETTSDTTPASLDIKCEHYALIDVSNGRVLLEKNGNEKAYPASMTKVMTILLGSEVKDIDKEITFSEDAIYSIEYGSSHISLMPGEILTLRQTLLGTALASGNDAANGVAEAVGGSIDNFVKLMNKRAQELGLTNTNFVNAHGLHDDNHYSTPIDMCHLLQAAIQNEMFVKICSQVKYIIPQTEYSSDRHLRTTNAMIDPEDEYYNPDVVLGKSGSDDLAGTCFVAYAKRDGKELICCLMKGDSREENWQDFKTIFDYGFDTYTKYSDADALVTENILPHTWKQIKGTFAVEGSYSPLLLNQQEIDSLKVEYVFDENVDEKAIGEQIGVVNLILNDQTIQTKTMVMEQPNSSLFLAILLWVLKIIAGLIVLGIFIFALLLAYKKIRQRIRRLKRQKNKKK